MILKFLGCFGAFWVDSMFAIPSRFEGNASRLLELKDFSCSRYLYILHFPFLLPGTFCFRFTILFVFPFAYSSGTVDMLVVFILILCLGSYFSFTLVFNLFNYWVGLHVYFFMGPLLMYFVFKIDEMDKICNVFFICII